MIACSAQNSHSMGLNIVLIWCIKHWTQFLTSWRFMFDLHIRERFEWIFQIYLYLKSSTPSEFLFEKIGKGLKRGCCTASWLLHRVFKKGSITKLKYNWIEKDQLVIFIITSLTWGLLMPIFLIAVYNAASWTGILKVVLITVVCLSCLTNTRDTLPWFIVHFKEKTHWFLVPWALEARSVSNIPLFNILKCDHRLTDVAAYQTSRQRSKWLGSMFVTMAL